MTEQIQEVLGPTSPAEKDLEASRTFLFCSSLGRSGFA